MPILCLECGSKKDSLHSLLFEQVMLEIDADKRRRGGWIRDLQVMHKIVH